MAVDQASTITRGFLFADLRGYTDFVEQHGAVAAAALLMARTRVYFTVWKTPRWMPLLLGLFLVAFFIWVAENIGTATRTWLYPSQRDGWSLVGVEKLGSWFLLLIISYTLVAWIKRRSRRTSVATPA